MKTVLISAALIVASVTVQAQTSPYLVDPDSGRFLGTLNSNRYDPDSVANPYGRYGSRYSPDSINNPYGRYGSPYTSDSARNPYTSGGPIIIASNQPRARSLWTE